MPPSNRHDSIAHAAAISELTSEELQGATDLLGLAYQDNPLMFYFFGEDQQVRRRTNELLLRLRLASMQPPALAIRDAGELIGVCGFDPPGGSNMSPDDMRQIFEALSAISVDGPKKAMDMLADWDTRRPAEPHWNLGPVGVDPARQGSGVGTALVQAFCDKMDRERAVAFLETDLESSANLYLKFGFETTAQTTVFDVPMWFMTRHPQT